MMRRGAFSLVELLVALAIVGVLLAGIAALLVSGLRFSATAVASADTLRELNYATSYVLDNARSSRTADSGLCTVATVDRPCLALVVPEARAGTTIDTYVRYVYTLEPRTSAPANVKPVDAWADDNSLVMFEYREVLCDASDPCGDPSAFAATLSVAGMAGLYIVLDRVDPTLPTFFDVTGGQVELEVRVIDQTVNGVVSVPDSGSYRVAANLRNAVP